MCTNCEDIEELASGTDGEDGNYGSYCLKWKFDTATGAGPASTFARFNNTTYTSATSLFINDTSSDSVSAQAFLETFDDTGSASNRGYIRVSKEFDSSIYAMFLVTAIVDNGTYHTVTVTGISSNGTFAYNDDVIICFQPTGATGVAGPQGTGAQKFDVVSFTRDTEYVQTNSGTYVTLAHYVWFGSTNGGTPTQVRLNGWVSNAANGGSIRVYDVTNSLVIAEQTGITAVSTANIITPVTIPLGNISATQAIWQIQGKVVTGGGADYVRCGSMALGFY